MGPCHLVLFRTGACHTGALQKDAPVLKDIQHPVEMPLLRALARYEQVPREAEAWRYLWIQKQHPDTVAAIRRAVAMGLVEGTEDADCDRLLELAGLKSAADLTSWELPTFDAVAQHCW